MMKRLIPLVTLIASAAILTACTSSPPPKTPGSEPGDMTAEGHKAAAQGEEAQADKHRDDAKRVAPSKPVVENAQKREHLGEAEKHDSAAADHRDAATKAEAAKK